MHLHKPGNGPVAREADKVTTNTTPHEVVSANLFPNEESVSVFTRSSPIMIQTQETVLSWDTIEGLFMTILQLRLQKRGKVVAMVATPPHGA